MTTTPAEFVADVVHALSAQVDEQRHLVAERDQQISNQRLDVQFARDETSRVRDELSRAKRDLEGWRTTKSHLEGEITKRDVLLTSQRHFSDRVDDLKLALWYYTVELAGHRDTAKTKAERIALGHVVERLADIRGVTAAERAVLDDPTTNTDPDDE